MAKREIPCFCREMNPDHPAHSLFTILTELPWQVRNKTFPSKLGTRSMCTVTNGDQGIWSYSAQRRLQSSYDELVMKCLTYSMVKDIVWKADYHLACQKISCFLYGIRRFITMFTKARHWILFWASRIQFAPSIQLNVKRSCQTVSPGPKRFETFRNNNNFLRREVVSPTPNPQAGGSSLVGCLRLLIQYIRSYPP
jgi:hypothetical protein